MAIETLRRASTVPLPIETVFEFFSKAENLEKLTPPWLKFSIVTPPPIRMRQGLTIEYRIRVRGLSLAWLTEIERWNPPFEFIDVQLKGPYKMWRHTHHFSESAGGTTIVDVVNYALPFGPLGRFLHWLQIRRDLDRIFDYRERRVRELLL